MRLSNSTFSSVGIHARGTSQPLTLTEGIRIYFGILFGVSVSVLAFYYLFPNVH